MFLAHESLGPTICVGEVLAEIVATSQGNGFTDPTPIIGPYPSSAPVIFIPQCNRIGGQASMIGPVGNDACGQVNRARLIDLGVDVPALTTDPWRDLPAEDALGHACDMIKAYVQAGFRKVHLDASMGCESDPAGLDDIAVAKRAARLAAGSEQAAADMDASLLLYIIGTEAPPPCGADHALDELEPTSAKAARTTWQIHQQVFVAAGLSAVLDRIIGLVVQPGVEFGNQNVVRYDAAKPQGRSNVLSEVDRLVFEAHSPDYQGVTTLSELMRNGFPISKVGPELTFVLREALYVLDLIASDLLPDYGDRPLYNVMEQIMLTAPQDWARHYAGSPAAQRWTRHYSRSDRIRYDWIAPAAQAAVTNLLDALRDQIVPLPLMQQHLPEAALAAGAPLKPEKILIARISECLGAYHTACTQVTTISPTKD